MCFFFFINLQTQRKIYFKTFVFHIIYINFKNPKVMKKVKFANLKFESVEVLTKKEQDKIVGGYGGSVNPPGSGFHCPNGISESWCYTKWTYWCGSNQVCYDAPGYYSCIDTCVRCGKC